MPCPSPAIATSYRHVACFLWPFLISRIFSLIRPHFSKGWPWHDVTALDNDFKFQFFIIQQYAKGRLSVKWFTNVISYLGGNLSLLHWYSMHEIFCVILIVWNGIRFVVECVGWNLTKEETVITWNQGVGTNGFKHISLHLPTANGLMYKHQWIEIQLGLCIRSTTCSPRVWKEGNFGEKYRNWQCCIKIF